MSFDAIRWAWKQRLSPTNKVVLMGLADYVRRDGAGCFPSVDRLADECCSSRVTVRRVLTLLEQENLIRSFTVAGRRGNTSNIYVLNLNGAPLEEFQRLAWGVAIAMRRGTVRPRVDAVEEAQRREEERQVEQKLQLPLEGDPIYEGRIFKSAEELPGAEQSEPEQPGP